MEEPDVLYDHKKTVLWTQQTDRDMSSQHLKYQTQNWQKLKPCKSWNGEGRWDLKLTATVGIYTWTDDLKKKGKLDSLQKDIIR